MAISFNPLSATETGRQDPTGTKTKDPADQLASKDTFLKLLVAQMQHQNPMNPSDGMEYVSQLSQFTEMEQMLGMRQDIGAIRAAIEAQASGSESKQE